MSTQRITQVSHAQGIVSAAIILGVIFALVVAAGASAVDESAAGVSVILFAAISTALLITRTFVRNRAIKNALEQRMIAIETMKPQLTAGADGSFKPTYGDFGLSSLDDTKGVRDIRYDNLIKGQDWAYADFNYSLYEKTKNGEYKDKTIYYSFAMVKLPRRLPHVLFDSPKMRKRQFRFVFASKQQRSLEGNFDTYFTTYFPNHYQIDSLSFITPEVMEAMVEAADYDIEIKGDCLFLYGDLMDPTKQVPDMIQKIKRIKKMLLNNIITYRDERLPYEKGRQEVTGFAVELWKNLTKDYALAFMYFVLLAAGVVTANKIEGFAFYLLLTGASGFAVHISRIRKELKHRKFTLVALEGKNHEPNRDHKNKDFHKA